MKHERLRYLREGMKLTQGETANKLGIVRPTYSNYENGNREPDNETLKKFAEFFGVTTDYLLGNDEPIINDQARNAVLDKYNRLPQKDREFVDEIVSTLFDKRKQGN